EDDLLDAEGVGGGASPGQAQAPLELVSTAGEPFEQAQPARRDRAEEVLHDDAGPAPAGRRRAQRGGPGTTEVRVDAPAEVPRAQPAQLHGDEVEAGAEHEAQQDPGEQGHAHRSTLSSCGSCAIISITW